jgi:hypothetical protein
MENPRLTIFAEEAILLIIKIATKNEDTISRYLNKAG